MLLPEDQLLIDRDRALPGLRMLFDAAAFADAVRPHLAQARLDGARLLYLRYKPGTSCLASYQLDTSAGRVDAYAIAYLYGENQKLRKEVSEAQPSAPGPGALVFPDLYVAVHFFPNDVRLGALRELATDDARRALLRKLLPTHPSLWDGAVTRLAYKPHRRYVAMLSVADVTQAVMKFYTRGGYEAALRNARAIETTPHLRVPRRMGRSSRHNIAVYHWIDGVPLGNVAQMSPAALERFGAAVREIHRQDAPKLPLIDFGAEVSRLMAVAAALGAVLPNLDERAQRAAQTLIDNFPEPGEITTIHGDLHAKQVLMTRKRVALLDLDEAARSSPLSDLGNFVGHLWRNAIQIGAPDDAVHAAGHAVVRGYDVSRFDNAARELAWHTAASLLRLTPHPFRIRERDWPAITEAMLARVERILRHEFAHARVHAPPRTRHTPVEDPFHTTADDAMGELVRHALNPALVSRYLAPAEVRAIKVTRCKARRRSIIEYSLGDGTIAIGKVRAKGTDRSAFRLLEALRRLGFDDDAPDGVVVPEPLALIEECGMWVQRKFHGTPATDLLRDRATRPLLARRIAEAVVKLHRAGVRARKQHTREDELAILRQRLDEVARSHPHWRRRIQAVCDACERLAHTLPQSRPTCGIHRDFYADHVLIADDGRMCLIDFDLYCEGDPALDVGNFTAHLTEQALREMDDALRLRDVERAVEDRFVELTGDGSNRHAVRVYRLLALARHIHISDRIRERRHLTEQVIELCERELAAALSPVSGGAIDDPRRLGRIAVRPATTATNAGLSATSTNTTASE
jgi:aminoglycoside phosphotransferase (APT) family kinase protein